MGFLCMQSRQAVVSIPGNHSLVNLHCSGVVLGTHTQSDDYQLWSIVHHNMLVHVYSLMTDSECCILINAHLQEMRHSMTSTCSLLTKQQRVSH